MAEPERLIEICAASALVDDGDGIRFNVLADGHAGTGFAVRKRGIARGYLNRCAHVAMELDWQLGKFFSSDGVFLVCATHGALYEPESGRCAGGPCAGRGGLLQITVTETGGRVYWTPDARVRAPV